jgi:hypothetical protein
MTAREDQLARQLTVSARAEIEFLRILFRRDPLEILALACREISIVTHETSSAMSVRNHQRLGKRYP